ncbi:MAG TPA: MBOAT family protein [Candidatus Avoscillospira avicola]|uniref:MBOAT family protein n=1 Tax=Candidatus Avoscillospira avicola TaxID=2840706 RepID=A0A9D1IVS2_9FIRM|nr:MBOAT family protein [Candidatus Avoscillospira avicola]
MVFSSIPFLFVFLPVTLLGYFLIPGRYTGLRNAFLLVMNLIFYAYGEPVYVLLMLLSVAVNFSAGLLLQRAKTRRGKKAVLIASVVLNLGALAFFKYTGLVLETLRLAPGLSWLPAVSVPLPIGISFYTFQAMSYVIDVYREDCPATRRFVDFAAYISLFPQLIAGPIVRYSDVAQQLQTRQCTVSGFSWGVKMFAVGLAKKVLLANQFALLWEQVAAEPAAYGTLAAWCGILAYALQIYFDFGGYSDMARGLGAMLGFDFMVNFNYPYIARSITEFWRRWHISLSTWFRDYVYIPLGGSRCSKGKMARNLMIVWMLTGIWHGAGWNFLLWGVYYGLLLLLEKLVLKRFLDRLPSAVRWVYTIVLVLIGWVFFASKDFAAAGRYLAVLFTPVAGTAHLWLPGWLPLGIVGAVAATPLGARLWSRWKARSAAEAAAAVLCAAALLLSTASLVSGGYNPFIYFNF